MRIGVKREFVQKHPISYKQINMRLCFVNTGMQHIAIVTNK